MQGKVRGQHLVRFEPFVLDLQTGELRKEGGASIRIPEQSFQILTILLEHPGEVVSREEIRKRLWPNDTVVEFDHSISAAMNRLRQVLGESAGDPHYIETFARRGYRWMCSVECMEESPVVGQVAVVPPRSASTNLSGEKVSHYRVLEILGGGGMGIVYKAEDLKLGRRVALKFLPEELAGDQRSLERFEREARAASALNHPNICTVYGIEDHEGRTFIAMELLEGCTLREMIPASSAPSTLALAKLFDLAIQITEGLDAAHQKGIIHRDIKPSNIFVTNRGEAKILDFGVAKLLETAESVESDGLGLPADAGLSETPRQPAIYVTRTGAAVGTEGYMSPEQVRGEKLDARTDLFSLGLVLYEMATSQRAFSGETASVLQEAILTQPPVSTRQINPGLPSKLERIINKALEKDRELRYQQASEIRDDLKSVVSKMARQDLGAIVKPALRSRWMVVAAGVFVLLTVSNILWLMRWEPPLLPPLTQRQLTTNSSENPISAGSISPDGRYLSYADLLGIHIKLITTGEIHTIPQPESLMGTQVNWGIINGWAPDGTRLIANVTIPGQQPSIWTAPVMAGTPHKIRDDAFAGAIARDGSWVAFIANPGEIGYREMWMMRPDGTDAHKVFESDANSGFLGAEWSPDSRRLSFEWGRRTGSKVEWNMVSRDLKGGPAVVAITSGIVDWSWSPDGRMIYSMDEPNLGVQSCNFWAVRLDRRTGRPLGPAERITNWAGFCMDNPSTTADGKRLVFRRWAPQGSVYVADLENNETHITPPKRLTLNEGLSYPASWTIDNKEVMFGSNREGRWRIYKQALNEGTAEAIETGTDEDVVDARLSPDGKWVFYIAVPRTKIPSPLYKLMGVSSAGGSPRLVMSVRIYGEPRCSRRPATICAIAEQTSDRKQLIFTAFDINGRIRELTRFNTEPNSFSRYVWDLSPDSTRIAILKSSESLIRILSLRDGTSKEVTVKDGSPLESLNWTADGEGFFASSHTKEGVNLLRLDHQGHTRIIWEQKGSIAPWNWDIPQWQGSPTAPLAVPSPDGRHLAIYEWSLSANMWMMENF